MDTSSASVTVCAAEKLARSVSPAPVHCETRAAPAMVTPMAMEMSNHCVGKTIATAATAVVPSRPPRTYRPGYRLSAGCCPPSAGRQAASASQRASLASCRWNCDGLHALLLAAFAGLLVKIALHVTMRTSLTQLLWERTLRLSRGISTRNSDAVHHTPDPHTNHNHGDSLSADCACYRFTKNSTEEQSENTTTPLPHGCGKA